MSMSFYVPPEQLMKDRADYAQKGIARGNSLIAVTYKYGLLLCAENPSTSLHKISEIYDRIAFAGVGKYSEFDQLRIAGIRHADLKGYSYSREDVDARGLANAYAQFLGQVFIHEQKPMEIEVLIAEVGKTPETDEIFHVVYDGTVNDEDDFTVVGGEPEPIKEHIKKRYSRDLDLKSAMNLCVDALNQEREEELAAKTLEVAILDRTKDGRLFRRMSDDEITAAIALDAPKKKASTDKKVPTKKTASKTPPKASGKIPDVEHP